MDESLEAMTVKRPGMMPLPSSGQWQHCVVRGRVRPGTGTDERDMGARTSRGPARIKVKVCGIRSVEDGRAALEAGAWALGFIFHKPSPRYIEPEDVAQIVQSLPEDTLTIGVFVDWPLDELNRAVKVAGIRGVQLHGREDPAYAGSVEAERTIKAFRAGPDFRPGQVLEYPGCGVLLDAYHPSLPGGTGSTADWSVAREVARLTPLILAGGIDPDNALDAIRAVQPDALDVSTGVEVSPGVKDPEKIRRLFATLRDAGV